LDFVDLIGTSGAAARAAPSRLERIRSELKAAECDALVAFGSLHAAHLAGYDRYLSDLADLVAVVVTADGNRMLVCGRLEVAPAEQDSDVDEIRGFGRDDLLTLDSTPALAAACRQVVGTGRLAVAGRPALVDLLGGVVEPFDQVLERIRRVKDPDEIVRVAAATRLAFLAQGIVEQGATDGQSELGLFSAARTAAEQTAGSPVGWVCTVAAGEHSALISPPFCVPGTKPVSAGAPLLCDISVRHRGYWGDTTRTYGGDTEVGSVRDTVTGVLDEMAAAALPGLPASALYAVGRDAIVSRIAGATALPHHGGHSLGAEIGERPQILPEDSMQLAEGMVLALEPAAYFAGRFGVRVENTYVVTAAGARRVEEVVA
jgi:Xaa-Pro aminopeptidase